MYAIPSYLLSRSLDNTYILPIFRWTANPIRTSSTRKGTMERNDPILCFQHCSDEKILCLQLPRLCPICHQPLKSSFMRVPPFRLPTPLVHSRDVPFLLVLRPTVCTFLECNFDTSDLHIGITDSDGVVYHYDEQGVNRDLGGWPQCLPVDILSKTSRANELSRLWDTIC